MGLLGGDIFNYSDDLIIGQFLGDAAVVQLDVAPSYLIDLLSFCLGSYSRSLCAKGNLTLPDRAHLSLSWGGQFVGNPQFLRHGLCQGVDFESC